jgi:hypothetical protein
MYICVYIYLAIYMYWCVFLTLTDLFIYRNIYTLIHIYIYIYIGWREGLATARQAPFSACIFICIYKYIYMHIHVHIHIHTYINIYTHMHIHTHTHTFTYIYIHIHRLRRRIGYNSTSSFLRMHSLPRNSRSGGTYSIIYLTPPWILEGTVLVYFQFFCFALPYFHLSIICSTPPFSFLLFSP